MLKSIIKSKPPYKRNKDYAKYFSEGGFNVRTLFANGEQGLWYDSSDLSSMYQDSAGTTAAVVGQPVGLILDKRLGAVRGAEAAPALEDANWVEAAGAVVGGGTATFTAVASGAGIVGNAPVAFVTGQFYEVTFTLANYAGGTGISVRLGGAGSFVNTGGSNGTKRIIIPAGGAATDISLLEGSGSGTYTFSGLSIRPLPGNHATQATSPSRFILRQDGNGYYYLEDDGFDDGMVTGSINFTATDKMTVWAGVDKQSDAAIGTVVEHSASSTANDGTFGLFAPITAATADYGFNLRGTTAQVNRFASPYAAPIARVLTAQYHVAAATTAAQTIARINGNAPTVLTTPAATGVRASFSANPLYIGRRGGAGLPFNGRIYSLIVRGATTTAAQLAQTERYIATKMGITL